MNWLDKITENSVRALARRTSRRSVLAGIGTLLVGAAAMPLLPVARGAEGKAPAGKKPPAGTSADPGDPSTCEYWRHCAIDGFRCTPSDSAGRSSDTTWRSRMWGSQKKRSPIPALPPPSP